MRKFLLFICCGAIMVVPSIALAAPWTPTLFDWNDGPGGTVQGWSYDDGINFAPTANYPNWDDTTNWPGNQGADTDAANGALKMAGTFSSKGYARVISPDLGPTWSDVPGYEAWLYIDTQEASFPSGGAQGKIWIQHSMGFSTSTLVALSDKWNQLSISGPFSNVQKIGITFVTTPDSPPGTWVGDWKIDNVRVVPIPSTLLLLGSGFIGVLGLRGKFRKK